MLIFFWQCKVYDLSTALFTALLLGWIGRRKYGLYHGIFPIICTNRETAFLMILVFALYGVSRFAFRFWSWSVGYQVLCFMAVRTFLAWRFADAPGLPFWFRPVENLQMYLESPIQSLVFLAAMIVTLWFCLRGWRQKPALLRTAFVAMTPCLAILYLLFGYTFEIRAFAELYPPAFALAVSLKNGAYDGHE